MDNKYDIYFSFSKKLAEEYGVSAAIMLHYFQFWVTTNKANNRNQHDGRTWVFNSVVAFRKIFPFWTSRQIGLTLGMLERKEVLVSGNYNKVKYDRTKSYAFKDEKLFIAENENGVSEPLSHFTKTSNGIDENVKSNLPKSQIELTETSNRIDVDVQPIPSNNTVNNTVNKKRVRTRFIAPSVEEVEAYKKEINFESLNSNQFVDYYAARGWKLNGQPMKDSKACVRTWKNRNGGKNNGSNTDKKQFAQESKIGTAVAM